MASLWSHSNSGVLWLNSCRQTSSPTAVHVKYIRSYYSWATGKNWNENGKKMFISCMQLIDPIWKYVHTLLLHAYKHVAKRVWTYFHYLVTLYSESSKARHQAHIITHRHLPNRQLPNSQIYLRISIRSAVIFLLHRIQFLFVHSWVLLLSC